MKFTISIDESLCDSTVLKVFYTGVDTLDSEILNILHTFVHSYRDYGCTIVFTAVQLFYITYDPKEVSGQDLGIKLYETLIQIEGCTASVDMFSSDPKVNWHTIRP